MFLLQNVKGDLLHNMDILGKIIKNFLSTVVTYQRWICSIISTFEIVWMPLMALPPHLPRNNVVISKQFSGQGAQNTTLLGGEEGRETVSVVLC